MVMTRKILAWNSEGTPDMTALRYLIVCLVLSAFAVRPAYAERLKINYVFPPDRPVAAAKLHPAAKGAVIGGVAGAVFWGGVGVWHCTIGPNEVGECDSARQWRAECCCGALLALVCALVGAFR
jgi:hypothetical protein